MFPTDCRPKRKLRAVDDGLVGPSSGLRRKSGGPILEWVGSSWRDQHGPGDAPAIEVVERVGDEAHRLLLGDALDTADRLHHEAMTGTVDLVYIDPPFASQADYISEVRLEGRGDADTEIHRTLAYADTWARRKGDGGIQAYLDELAPRLARIATLIAPTGTLWVHLDWRAAYLVRVLLDEILGRERFINEIVWKRAPNLGRQAASFQFGRTLDTLLVYGGPRARLRPPMRLEPIDESAIRWDDEGRPFTAAPRGDYTDASVKRLDGEGRIHRTASGKVYVKYFLVRNGSGVLCRERPVDALWTDIPPLRHAPPTERTGFPTQKPRALLERIIGCATPPGAIVVDLFSGSGTTAEVAHRMGRRAIVGDAGPVSLATTRARLLRAGAGLTIARCRNASLPPGPPLDVRVENLPDGMLQVALDPSLDPLAWAIDGEPIAGGPFRTTWHAERTLGLRPTAVQRTAQIPASGQSPRVRVFHNDGTVSEGSP